MDRDTTFYLRKPVVYRTDVFISPEHGSCGRARPLDILWSPEARTLCRRKHSLSRQSLQSAPREHVGGRSRLAMLVMPADDPGAHARPHGCSTCMRGSFATALSRSHCWRCLPVLRHRSAPHRSSRMSYECGVIHPAIRQRGRSADDAWCAITNPRRRATDGSATQSSYALRIAMILTCTAHWEAPVTVRTRYQFCVKDSAMDITDG